MAFTSVASRQAALGFGSAVSLLPWTDAAGIDSDEAALALGTYPLGGTSGYAGPVALRASLWINEVDTWTAFGFFLQDEGDSLHGIVTRPNEVTGPGVAATLFTGPGTTPTKEFTLRGVVHVEGSFSATRLAVIGLKALVEDGTVSVRLDGWNTVVIEAKCVGFKAVNQQPKQVTDWVDVEMTFRSESPVWRDVAARGYAFDSTPTPMPMGTGDVAPDYWLYGPANNPVLSGYDYKGNQLWSSTVVLNLGATDAVRIVTGAFQQAVYKYLTSPTGVRDNSLIPAGTFPKGLFASGRAYALAQWPMVKVSLGTGKAIYPRTWK
jgi:hypothetical protein